MVQALSAARWVAAASCLLALPAPAAAQADGAYPSVVACNAVAAAPAVQASLTVEIAGGKAVLRGPDETATGTVQGRGLVLSGKGRGFTSRYSGEVGGRGGLLTGARTYPGGLRQPCQVILGDGRG